MDVDPAVALPDPLLLQQLQRGLFERKTLLDVQLAEVAKLKREREAEAQRAQRLNTNRQRVVTAETSRRSRDRSAEEKVATSSEDASVGNRLRMRIAREDLDKAMEEFNRVTAALQIAKDTLSKKRGEASAAKKRYKTLVKMLNELIEMSEAIDASGAGSSEDRTAAVAAAKLGLLTLQRDVSFAESDVLHQADSSNDDIGGSDDDH